MKNVRVTISATYVVTAVSTFAVSALIGTFWAMGTITDTLVTTGLTV